MPILTEQLDHALCKLSWAPSGQLVAVGDVDGTLHVFEAGEVRTDGWKRGGKVVCVALQELGLYYVQQCECLIASVFLRFVCCLGFAVCNCVNKPLKCRDRLWKVAYIGKFSASLKFCEVTVHGDLVKKKFAECLMVVIYMCIVMTGHTYIVRF